ncbi:MAG: hypothetical protein ACREU2_14110 [Steroidobacteraceae bacterium]
MAEDGVRGITSNPSLFEKAIGGSTDYDGALLLSRKVYGAVADAYLRQHGRPHQSLEEGVEGARQTLAMLERSGISLETVIAITSPRDPAQR